AYFTLTNSGDRADKLTSASSPAARLVRPMQESGHGGVMSMKPLRSLVVPSHGKVTLTPGHYHIMLEKLTGHLEVGDRVRLTLSFAHAGDLRVSLPVVPLTSTGGSGTSGGTSHMDGM